MTRTTLPLGIGMVGCGNIAQQYASTMASHDELRLVAATDVDAARAEAIVEEHGGRVHPSLRVLLEDPAVDIVVNLTTHDAHYAVTKLALEAGRHVYSEKPLAIEAAEAHELVELARRQHVRLACAPSTFLGEAQQTLGSVIRRGDLGVVRAIYADMSGSRIESWHPSPIPFYRVGPMVDVGVYPLTIVTAFLGPAVAIEARGWELLPERVTKDGKPFRIGSPDLILASIELSGGAVMRLTSSFYVGRPSQQGGLLELHGDDASIALGNPITFDAPLEMGPAGGEYQPLMPIRPPYRDVDWGRGVADLARAIVEARPQRVTGEHAAHVVDILSAARRSMRERRRIEIDSAFDPPALTDWAGDYEPADDSRARARRPVPRRSAVTTPSTAVPRRRR